MFGMNRCRASYSPRNADDWASMTSVMSALWNDAKSAASCTMDLDMSTAWGRPSFSCRNMSPNDAALASASWRDRPMDRADPFDHASISRALDPKITRDLDTVSFRSDAASIVFLTPLMIAVPPRAANPIPIPVVSFENPDAIRRVCPSISLTARENPRASPTISTFRVRVATTHPLPSLLGGPFRPGGNLLVGQVLVLVAAEAEE